MVIIESILNILVKFYEILPSVSLKYKLKNGFYYCYFKYFSKYRFKVTHNKNNFLIECKNGIIFKINEDIVINFALALPGYLANYDLKNGDIVVDCGAFVGDFTVYAAKVVGPQGRVIAFEPDDLNYEHLVNNIKMNNLTNIIAIKKGLWSENALMDFDNEHSIGSSLQVSSTNHCIKKVQVVTLDNELEKQEIKKVDFIKMDIEGAEIEAIKGCKNILKNGANVACRFSGYMTTLSQDNVPPSFSS